jgi:integrase
MAERRVRARGHIQQRPNGTYRVIVYAGRDPFTRRERRLTGTASTPREAERLRTRLLGQVDGQRLPNTKATVRQLLDRWLETANLELSTRHNYEGYVRRQINPALGDLPIGKLTPETLDSFYAHLRGGGGARSPATNQEPQPGQRAGKGRPLAPSTIRQIHFILRAALGLAVRWGWLSANPAELASPPGFSHHDPEPPTPEQVAQLLDAAWASDPDFGTLLWLATTTGMRRGELCALRWPRVRLDEATLLVNRNYVQRGTTRKEKDTKTHQSRRIALDEVTVAILTEHLERCRARAAAVGVGLAASAYVFSLAPDGAAPLLPDSVTQRYRRLAKRLGLSSTLHDLRHFSATQLLAAGVDLRTVAGRLGHGGGGATTLRVYAAFVADADRRAAALLGTQLPRPGSAQLPSSPAEGRPEGEHGVAGGLEGAR